MWEMPASSQILHLTKKYAGVGATVVARIKNTRTPFGIDFGVGDVIVPKQEKRKLPTQLDGFDAPTVNTYSLETTIAEKLDAILNLMEFSSRMKDYYDIYYLANKFDFDGATLAEALSKTFANRAHTFTAAQFEQIIGFDSDDAMQKKWRAFCRKTDIKTDDYGTVLKTIKANMLPNWNLLCSSTGNWKRRQQNLMQMNLQMHG